MKKVFIIKLVLLFTIMGLNIKVFANDIKYIKKDNHIDMVKVFAYDMIPGGGHLYLGNYKTSALFFSLKLSSYFSIYYFYSYMKYRESLYISAKSSNQLLDSNHELLFKDPEGGYKTVDEMKHQYERAAHYLTLSIIATITIHCVSWYILYRNIEKINDKSLPVYDLTKPQFSFMVGNNHLMFAIKSKI